MGSPDGQFHPRGRDVPRRVHLLAERNDHGGNRRTACAAIRDLARGVRRSTRVESQRKAGAAIAGGRFHDEIAPVTVTDARRARTRWSPPTNIRGPTRRSSRCESSPPVFPNVEGQPGSITAGTSSGITDGGRRARAHERGRARERGIAADGADHRVGLAPVSIQGSWASVRCRRCASCLRGPG